MMHPDNAFANRYGRFIQSGRRYEITDPMTPTPWVNVISNGRYGLVVSQQGGGFSWLDNSQLNVLTRWEMDLALDRHGRFMYVRDDTDGRIWSLAPAPCHAAYESFSCEHAQGSTTFRTSFASIRATWTLAAASTDTGEAWTVDLTNDGETARSLTLCSFFEWCCGVAPDTKREFHRLFITTELDRDRQAIVATKNMWDVPPRSEAEHWNRPWPYAAAHSVAGIDSGTLIAHGDKRVFIGGYGDPASPAGLRSDATRVGEFGRFGDACAALGGSISLKPGETRRVVFTLAASTDRAAALATCERIGKEAIAGDRAAAAEDRWLDLTRPTQIRSSWSDLDLLCNHWLPYQAISARMWARTGYYQQSGAYGYRDQLQDSQIWLSLNPERCLDQIKLHARHQFADGSVYHWWHPLTETGLRTQCSDDYLWLPLILSAYVRETGNVAAVAHVEPFVDQTEGTSLVDHCERSLNRAMSRLSPRGIPLIGSCDWNDGLSSMGVEGRGESVWLAMFLAHTLREFANVYVLLGQPDAASKARGKAQSLIDAVEKHGWDGAYYRYGTRDDGQWVGSSSCAEGKIHLNAQTWAVLVGVGDVDRRRSAWNSVRQHLVTDYGALLLAPAYTIPDPAIGYITRYAPGTRENGGVYMHAATWAIAASCEMGDIETAERLWRAVSPPTRCADADAYRAEPYVLPGNVDGPLSDLPGRAGWTWYTGSAQWLRTVAIERILGVRATWEGLSIAPCAPASLGDVEVSRRWRGCDVTIRFRASECVAGRRPTLRINGRAVPGHTVTTDMIAGCSKLDVEATWESGGVEVKPGAQTPRRATV